MFTSDALYYFPQFTAMLCPQMGRHKVETSEEKVKSVGRMTVKTTRETLPYTVLGELI